nr:uncharacterized protein LOC113737220 isoform X2 [Coffea arabica]
MQDPKNSSQARKPWYQRAMQMATVWKGSVAKPTEIPTPNASIWKTISRSTEIPGVIVIQDQNQFPYSKKLELQAGELARKGGKFFAENH